MKPVDQTIFEDGKGNCLAASVASILGIPLDEVPNFAELGYFDGLRIWLGDCDLCFFEVRFADPVHCSQAYFNYSPEHLLVWGDSPRRYPDGRYKQHACVGKGMGYGIEVVHDPHPSRDGLRNIYGVMLIYRLAGGAA